MPIKTQDPNRYQLISYGLTHEEKQIDHHNDVSCTAGKTLSFAFLRFSWQPAVLKITEN